jgi:hypothetical protein
MPRPRKKAIPVHLSLIDRFFRRLETWPIPPAVSYALLAATGAVVLQTSLWVCGASRPGSLSVQALATGGWSFLKYGRASPVLRGWPRVAGDLPPRLAARSSGLIRRL